MFKMAISENVKYYQSL